MIGSASLGIPRHLILICRRRCWQRLFSLSTHGEAVGCATAGGLPAGSFVRADAVPVPETRRQLPAE